MNQRLPESRILPLVRVLAAIAMGLTAVSVQAQYLSAPKPGDVYREYTLVLGGNRWRVTDPNALNEGAAAFLPNPVQKITLGDLDGATRAELLIDLWGGHPGTSDKRIRFNENEWLPVPELATPPRTPECYTSQANLSVEIPLEHLQAGVNLFEGTSGGQICTNFQWGQWGWYGVVLRVFYDDAKPHPLGVISSPAGGATFGDDPTITADVDSPVGVRRVDFLAYYDGYDTDGDGRFADYHESYHRRAGEGFIDIGNHVGTATAAPFEVLWDTSFVPDQAPGSIKLLARILDKDGVWYVTDEVTGLSLARDGFSVRLYKPGNIGKTFWVRAGQEKSSTFTVPSGDDLYKAVSAHLLLATWNGFDSEATTLLNGHEVPARYGENHFYSYDAVAVPPSAVITGSNHLSFSSVTTHHGLEVLWPGPGMLVRYADAAPTPAAPPCAFGFEEEGGFVVEDGAGAGNHGLLRGGARRVADGRFGRAVGFAGSYGQHVDLGSFDFAGDLLTIAFWARPDHTGSGEMRLFSKTFTHAPHDTFCSLSILQGGYLQFGLNADGTTHTIRPEGATVVAGEWTHIAATYDGARMRLFQDGVEVAARDKRGALRRDPAVEVWLGNNSAEPKQTFAGLLDEVWILDEALAEVEIANLGGRPVVGATFLRGDANGDGEVAILDAIFTLRYLFVSGAHPGCDKAADANDSGAVDLADAVTTLRLLFVGGLPPVPPYPACGLDESEDDLACETYTACP